MKYPCPKKTSPPNRECYHSKNILLYLRSEIEKHKTWQVQSCFPPSFVTLHWKLKNTWKKLIYPQKWTWYKSLTAAGNIRNSWYSLIWGSPKSGSGRGHNNTLPCLSRIVNKGGEVLKRGSLLSLEIFKIPGFWRRIARTKNQISARHFRWR